MSELRLAMKMAANQVIDSKKLCNAIYGVVLSVSPLKVKLDQKMTITSDFLILTQNVMDYETEVQFDGKSGIMKVKNGLKTGDKVLLLQREGGQEFIILDRL